MAWALDKPVFSCMYGTMLKEIPVLAMVNIRIVTASNQ